MKKIQLPTISVKKFLESVAVDLIASLLISVSIIVFARNANFAPGGISGMGLILNYVTGLPVGRLILALNVPMILLCFRFLGKEFFFTSVKTMVISSYFIDHVAVLLPAFTGSRWLAAVLSGVFAGVGYALVYMQNSSTGGSDFLIMTAKKLRPNMSIGQLTQIIDGSVIFIGAFVLKRVDAVLLGLIYTAVNSFTIDLVMKKITPWFKSRRFIPVRPA